MQKLTQRQKMVLDFIQSSIETDGYPPTLREIGNHMGIRSTNGVNDHLRALERKGYLTRKDMKSRTLRPTNVAIERLYVDGLETGTVGDTGDLTATRNPQQIPTRMPGFLPQPANTDMMRIPLVGSVAAGNLKEAIPRPDGYVHIDRMLVGTSSSQDVFGLRIDGESMIEAGIHDGDYVFVRKGPVASRGEIVIAVVDGEATCKYFYHEGEQIRLQPANSTMTPIYIHSTDWRETQVVGTVVGVYRKLNS